MFLYPAGAANFDKQLKEAMPQIQILGSDVYSAGEMISNPSSEGVIYSVGHIESPEKLMAAAEAVSGKKPNVMTPVVYDGVKLLAATFSEVGTDKVAVKEALKITDYQGAGQRISFDANREMSSASYDVFTIKDGKSVLLN